MRPQFCGYPAPRPRVNEARLFRHILSGKHTAVFFVRFAIRAPNVKPLKWRVRRVAKIFYHDECKQRVTIRSALMGHVNFLLPPSKCPISFRCKFRTAAIFSGAKREKRRRHGRFSVILASHEFFFFFFLFAHSVVLRSCVNSDEILRRRQDKYDTSDSSSKAHRTMLIDMKIAYSIC